MFLDISIFFIPANIVKYDFSKKKFFFLGFGPHKFIYILNIHLLFSDHITCIYTSHVNDHYEVTCIDICNHHYVLKGTNFQKLNG